MDILFDDQKNIDIRKYEIDLSIRPDESNFLLLVNNKKIGSKGNFVVITGKPKTRKTTFAHSIIAAALEYKNVLGFEVRTPFERPDVVLIDTEQDRNDIAYNVQRINNLTGNDIRKHQNFKIYSLCDLNPSEIISFINTMFLTNKHIGILIIDGILDLINDMNDIKESRELLHQIKIWARNNNCLIITILHQSKSTGYSIGHLGSFSDRKAQSVLSVEKDKDEAYSVLSAQYLRSDAPFDPIKIFYNTITNKYETI